MSEPGFISRSVSTDPPVFPGAMWKGSSIHFFVVLILPRVSGNLELVPGDSGNKAGDTLDMVATFHGVQSHTDAS